MKPISPNLDNIRLIAAILMVISLPFSESLKTISLFFLLFVLLVQMYRGKIKIEISAIHFGFISLLCSALLSSMFAADPTKSLKGAKDVLFYTIPFFAACSMTNEKHVRIILWSLYISTTLAALSGIFDSIQMNRPLEIHALGNQNYTAMFFIIVALSMISSIIFSDKEATSSKIIIGILASLIIIAAVMTVMRTSFLGLFVFLLILLVSKKRSTALYILTAGITLLIVFATYSNKSMLEKILSTKSLISRVDLWNQALKYFMEHPITGIGLNHFVHRFSLTHPVEPGNTVFDAHSVYFQTAAQMGIFGLLSLFLIIFGFLYQFVKIKATSGFERAIKYSALGGFLVTFAGGIFDTTLHHEHAIVFALLTGLMIGLDFKNNK